MPTDTAGDTSSSSAAASTGLTQGQIAGFPRLKDGGQWAEYLKDLGRFDKLGFFPKEKVISFLILYGFEKVDNPSQRTWS